MPLVLVEATHTFCILFFGVVFFCSCDTDLRAVLISWLNAAIQAVALQVMLYVVFVSVGFLSLHIIVFSDQISLVG